MGLLTDGREGQKGPPLPKIYHTYPIMMKLGTVIPCLKKIQKIYESRDTHLEFCWRQRFFTGNQQIFLYQEIQIQTAFWYIVSIFLTFLESLKIFLTNLVTCFDDVSKNDYPRTFEIKRLWRHNSFRWCHQQNFIT